MDTDDSSKVEENASNKITQSYVIRLNNGQEFAEFSPTHWRLTIYHVLGISRQVNLGYVDAHLLDFLIKHSGEMLSRQELLEHAWSDRIVSQGSLNQAISNLRAILGDDQAREIIITVPRRGYQLNADVLMDWQDWLIEKETFLNVEGVNNETDNSPPPINVSKIQRLYMPVLISSSIFFFILLLIGLALPYYFTIFPPFVSEQMTVNNIPLTLIAKDRSELELIRSDVREVFKDAESGGRVLIHQRNDTLELNCIRPDRGVYRLQSIKSLRSIDASYFKECLR